MAAIDPFDVLIGLPLTIYVAPVGEAVPDVDNTPAGNWVDVGITDGDQTSEFQGDLTFWSDNTEQGDTVATRPYEAKIFTFTLVSMTLENMGRIMDSASDVVTDAGPPATKKLPLQRGAVPNPYAMLLKASSLSPYAASPAMYVIPKGVFDGIDAINYGQDQRAEFAVEFRALADKAQPAADRLGWLIAETT